MKPLLINGEQVTTTEWIEDINPSDQQDIVDRFAVAGTSDTQSAIAAAKAAFPAWSASSIQIRHDVLQKTSAELASRSRELGELLAREEGKTLREAVAEVTRAAQIFDFFSGETLRLSGEILPSVRPGVRVDMTREPVGVVGVIAPWNYPMAIPAWKIAPALCYGNTVVFKPAELVPGCGWAMVDIIMRAGAPPGVVNLVNGPGRRVGQTILDSPDVDAVSFTGSTATGRTVAQACIAHMRKFQVEMGGKNPLIVLDDADLEIALQCAIDGAFFSTGQRCTASSRLIVTEGIHNRFVEELAQRVRGLQVGHALAEDTQIGPVVDENQLAQNLDYLSVATTQGGNLRAGGELLQRETKGHFMQPALLTDTTNDMRINREEVFGPIASVIRVKDYDEALHVANDTEFGLSAGICTTTLKHAAHFQRNAAAGMVMVNLPTAGVDYHVPFGGTKGSSYGAREQGSYAAEFFTTLKTGYTRA